MHSVVNSEEYRSKSPKQIVSLLADGGMYLGSVSIVYCILRAKIKSITGSRPARRSIAIGLLGARPLARIRCGPGTSHT